MLFNLNWDFFFFLLYICMFIWVVWNLYYSGFDSEFTEEKMRKAKTRSLGAKLPILISLSLCEFKRILTVSRGNDVYFLSLSFGKWEIVY